MQNVTAEFQGSLSADVVPPAARIAFWNHLSSRLFGSVRIDSRSRAPFHSELLRISLRDVDLFSIKSSPVALFRPPVPALRAEADNLMSLMIICSGEGRASLAGQQVCLLPGDFMLMSSDASNYYVFDEPTHVLKLLLHGVRLECRLGRLRHYLNRRMRPDGSGASFLSNFFVSNWSLISGGYQAHWSDSLSDTFWSLFDLAFAGDPAALGTSSRRPQLRQAAQRLVEIELSNPEFGVNDIASSLNVSARYVQSLFSDLSMTPSQYLLRRRLEVAADRLRDAVPRRIGAVALSVGFNDMAYFSRAFRKQFGLSARSFRLMHGPQKPGVNLSSSSEVNCRFGPVQESA